MIIAKNGNIILRHKNLPNASTHDLEMIIVRDDKEYLMASWGNDGFEDNGIIFRVRNWGEVESARALIRIGDSIFNYSEEIAALV